MTDSMENSGVRSLFGDKAHKKAETRPGIDAWLRLLFTSWLWPAPLFRPFKDTIRLKVAQPPV